MAEIVAARPGSRQAIKTPATPEGGEVGAHAFLTPQTRQILDNFRLQEIGSHLLRRAHFAAEERFAQAFPDETITPRQKAALIIVYQQPGLNQNTLADQLAMDRNSIAEMIKRLVNSKLLLRMRANSDKRAYQLYLAPAGARLLNQIMPRDLQLEEQLLKRLPEEYRLLFMKCLKLLVDQNLPAAQAPPTEPH